MWNDSLRLSLYLFHSTVRPGDTLPVRVRVENFSALPIDYTMWSIGAPPISIQIRHPYHYPNGASVTLRAAGDADTVLPAIDYATLAPADSIERIVRWDLTIPTSSSPMPAPNQTYILQADFFPGHQDGTSDDNLLRLTQQISVTGSRDVLVPREAEASALRHPQAQKWAQAHSGAAIARQDGGIFSVNFAGAWTEITRAEFGSIRQGTIESDVVLLDRDTWEVRLSSKHGYRPDQFTLRVDAETGGVLSVAPDLDAGLADGVLATFDTPEGTFNALFKQPDAIDALHRLQAGETAPTIPIGSLLPGPGAGLHNAPWTWHMDPGSIELADFTIELCDGTAAFVEEERNYWLDTVGQYCPWSATLVDVQDFR